MLVARASPAAKIPAPYLYTLFPDGPLRSGLGGGTRVFHSSKRQRGTFFVGGFQQSKPNRVVDVSGRPGYPSRYTAHGY